MMFILSLFCFFPLFSAECNPTNLTTMLARFPNDLMMADASTVINSVWPLSNEEAVRLYAIAASWIVTRTNTNYTIAIEKALSGRNETEKKERDLAHQRIANITRRINAAVIFLHEDIELFEFDHDHLLELRTTVAFVLESVQTLGRDEEFNRIFYEIDKFMRKFTGWGIWGNDRSELSERDFVKYWGIFHVINKERSNLYTHLVPILEQIDILLECTKVQTDQEKTNWFKILFDLFCAVMQD